jgi:DNA-binding CsgD family transcriptional regulator
MRLDALRKLWERLRRGGDVERTLDSDSFTDSEVAVGRMILPLLGDLSAAQKVIEELTSQTRALKIVLDLLPVAALVVDIDGRLLTSNAAARALFEGPGVPSRVVESAVRALKSGTEIESSTVTNADGSGLTLRLAPAEVGEDESAPTPGVIFLVPTGKPVEIKTAMLQKRFGLTPAQMKVVEHVCGGMTNREIAGELGLSPETVRKHVASVFARTGVNKRSALVALAFGARYGQSAAGEIVN